HIHGFMRCNHSAINGLSLVVVPLILLDSDGAFHFHSVPAAHAAVRECPPAPSIATRGPCQFLRNSTSANSPTPSASPVASPWPPPPPPPGRRTRRRQPRAPTRPGRWTPSPSPPAS